MNSTLRYVLLPVRDLLLSGSHRAVLCFAVLILGFVTPSVGQEITVSGKVTASGDNSPLPGVSVLIKGTSTGTTTDTDGQFTLRVPDPSATLVFSFIGYAPQELSVGSRTALDVSLVADVTELNEVVVVGYGSVKKTDLTGAVATIDPAVITKRGPVSALEGVQGQVAGVDISNP
jgi:hypothetical protein